MRPFSKDRGKAAEKVAAKSLPDEDTSGAKNATGERTEVVLRLPILKRLVYRQVPGSYMYVNQFRYMCDHTNMYGGAFRGG